MKSGVLVLGIQFLGDFDVKNSAIDERFGTGITYIQLAFSH